MRGLWKAAEVFWNSGTVPCHVFLGNILLMFFLHQSEKKMALIKISIVFATEEGSLLVVVMVISG